MKRLILAFVLIISIIFSYAQKTVAVLSGTTWSFYDDFSPALRAAPAGATIYVPGGTFDLGTNGDTINKPITIIGVGYHIDSTGATGRSILTGNFSFANGGDNVSIIGVYLNGNVQILNSNNSVSNTYLFRSRINDIEVRSGNTNYMFNSIMINECVVNNIGAINSNMVTQNIVISNSFCSSIRYLWDADIKNNIISGGYYYSGLLRSYALYSLYNCRIENNIIYGYTKYFVKQI
ncbi:MAG: hypothetical protein IPP60_08815 [Sphingobacteriales bacterium]|nr:hypothetical protein [Sphingobacteriales bacterium]